MTALVVDDDQTIRSIVRAVLTNRSYRVLEAVDMDEALAACDQHQGPLRILIADVMLKTPDGLETAARLMEARPELRVLFISGYPAGRFKRDLEKLPTQRVRFLQKPFAPEKLLSELDALLADRDAATSE